MLWFIIAGSVILWKCVLLCCFGDNGCFMVGHKTWLTGAKGESSWVGMGSAVH